MTRKSNNFRWKALSQRQKQVLSWWAPQSAYSDYNGIVADGAIRSGKTFAMGFSFVQWGMACFDGQQFAMCGKTILALRRNVLNTLKRQLQARGYSIKEHRADNCWTVSKGGRTNEFYFFGGKDEGSQDLIQGITLADAFFDEVALMPQSFVNQATARCSVTGSKFWFNCNPGNPQHWFYIEWLCKVRSRRLVYLHFTMDDNLSLDESIKERYRRQYTGVFYQRYILGLWVAAEKKADSMTAWRIEGTLREFARFDPVDLWFDYPVHKPDSGLLEDLHPENDFRTLGSKGASKRWGDRAKVTKDKKAELDTAYEACMMDGEVTVYALAEYMDLKPRTIKTRLKEDGRFWIDGEKIGRKEPGSSG